MTYTVTPTITQKITPLLRLILTLLLAVLLLSAAAPSAEAGPRPTPIETSEFEEPIDTGEREEVLPELTCSSEFEDDKGILECQTPISPDPTTPPNNPPTGPKRTAAVAIGDSFVSGEGAGSYKKVRTYTTGKWQSDPGWSANDRGAFFCHRSANASIEVAQLPGIDDRFNLACSGGQPADITARSYGRLCPKFLQQLFGKVCGRDVDSQISQLLDVAATHDIELVLIGLGSNNSKFTFGDAAGKCVGRFLNDAWFGWWETALTWRDPDKSQEPCKNSNMASQSDLATAEAETIDAVRAIINALDGVDNDYRIVLQSYTNPLPLMYDSSFLVEAGKPDTADKFRDLGAERYAAGCPAHLESLAPGHWFSGELGSIVNNTAAKMRSEFPNHDIVFLDVQKAFDGDRLCEKPGSPTGALAAPMRLRDNQDRTTPVDSIAGFSKLDLARLGKACKQYYQTCQESLHPNEAGHVVLGECLTAAWESANSSDIDCERINGATSTGNGSVNFDLILDHVTWGPVGLGTGRFTINYTTSLTNTTGTVQGYAIKATFVGSPQHPSTTITGSASSGTLTGTRSCTEHPEVVLEARVTIDGVEHLASKSWKYGDNNPNNTYPTGILGC